MQKSQNLQDETIKVLNLLSTRFAWQSIEEYTDKKDDSAILFYVSLYVHLESLATKKSCI